MKFVVMDLEWNNAYSKRLGGYINEIIEIGAVKLDENMETVGSFSRVVRSQISKKLRGSVKRLTHLTDDDINSGAPFTKVFSEFKKWIGDEETVVATWGDGDARVLLDNFTRLNGVDKIPFFKFYCDLQKCFQKYSKRDKGKQAGLLAAAEVLEINSDEFVLHRALGDGMLAAEILKKLLPAGFVEPELMKCDEEFYARLLFKARVIGNIDDPLVDKKKMEHSCEICGERCGRISDWKLRGQFFRADFYCEKCDRVYSVGVRFKRLYDAVEFKKIVSVRERESQNETGESSE